LRAKVELREGKGGFKREDYKRRFCRYETERRREREREKKRKARRGLEKNSKRESAG